VSVRTTRTRILEIGQLRIVRMTSTVFAGRIATGHNHAAPACRVILLRCMSLLLCTNAKCSDVRYLVAVKENADVADIAFFVDAEVIRGGPLIEVAEHGREVWRAAPGSARLL
jgi:hypothetical protein